jgi:hypothetical protein
MTPGEFALLAAFAAEVPLAGAAEAAIERDPAFDLAAALAVLLTDGVLGQPIMGQTLEPVECPP